MDATSGTANVGKGPGRSVQDLRAADPHRRPSGEPPPLPRELGRSGKFFLLLVAYFTLALVGFLLFPSFEAFFERWDHTRQRWITDLRTPGLTRVMLASTGSGPPGRSA